MVPEHRVVVLEDLEDLGTGEPLDGVPFDCWWMGFLKKVLGHAGVRVSYPYLVGVSGEAFSIHYETGHPVRAWRIWTYEGRGDYDFLNRACRAAGFAFTIHRPADFATALREVSALVDQGRPALLSCSHGPALFIGYHVPEGLYRWIHPLAVSEKIDEHGWAIPETLQAHWSKAWLPFAEPSPYLYLTFERAAARRPAPEAAHEALRTALAQAQDCHAARSPDLRRGDAAWARWIADLEAGRAREEFLYGAYLDRLVAARMSAARFCLEAAEVLPEAAEGLQAAADDYDRLVTALLAVREHARSPAGGATRTAELAASLREARELDREAVQDIRDALFPETPPGP